MLPQLVLKVLVLYTIPIDTAATFTILLGGFRTLNWDLDGWYLNQFFGIHRLLGHWAFQTFRQGTSPLYTTKNVSLNPKTTSKPEVRQTCVLLTLTHNRKDICMSNLETSKQQFVDQKNSPWSCFHSGQAWERFCIMVFVHFWQRLRCYCCPWGQMGVWYGDVYVGISKFGSLQFKAIFFQNSSHLISVVFVGTRWLRWDLVSDFYGFCWSWIFEGVNTTEGEVWANQPLDLLSNWSRASNEQKRQKLL